MAKANPKTASIEDLKQDGAQGEDAPKQPNKGKVKSDEPLLPTSITLSAPHGFIDEDTGEHRYWHAGMEVTDPEEIKLLIDRQAPLE
ncbi:hypothetical protein ICN48_05690 [Polynucleobacter sp. JS-Safj-400b-B2]|uniref:hypothetical protein n=1 Tax=Polynucleobacter sp. JS-Safj-400b-B2 TaxID=2576921 RepID=UPI001C0E56F8|nr:hypothetical protein [Polynucleobacter sp. JS-Safj-400b-B2]MBU3625726.1 hypothetical protein [Polynucleobacter sp. JS-Safj-400b-B2]